MENLDTYLTGLGFFLFGGFGFFFGRYTLVLYNFLPKPKKTKLV